MNELDPLILDFLEWLSIEPRPYLEVMETWRTSCPRLTIWEDSVDRNFVTRLPGQVITVTPEGQQFLRTQTRRHVRSTSARTETRI